MAAGHPVSSLNEYAQKHGLTLRYEPVGSEGLDHNKNFKIRAVVDDKPYPIGVGKTKKDAKLNAAQNALKCLQGDGSHDLQEDSADEGAPVGQNNINYICWLNEYSQKNIKKVTPLESARPRGSEITYYCKFKVDEKEYPEVSAKTKREAKEEAAKLVYDIIEGNPNPWVADTSEEQKRAVDKSVEDVCSRSRSPSLNFKGKRPSESNFIGIINNYCQKTRRCFSFVEVKRFGPSDKLTFVYRLIIDGKDYPDGEGRSVKEAQQNAARLAWSALQEQSDYDSKVSNASTGSESDVPSTAQSSALDSSSSQSIIFANSSTASQEQLRTAASGQNTFSNFSTPSSSNPLDVARGTPDSGMMSDSTRDQNNTQNEALENKSATSTQLRIKSDFDILERVGRGGFGRVFRVKNKLDGKEYAVKMVPGTEESLREVIALSELQHGNIVRYYSCWMDPKYEHCEDSTGSSESTGNSCKNYLYISMELCKPETLKDWIKDKSKENLQINQQKKESLAIAKQIVSGVAYIHSKNCIHRDLKPANIMFGMDGTVKIGDFGLVTTNVFSDENMDRTQGAGTKSYLAPEQESKEYDHKVDMFALGLVFFELLWKMSTGHEKKKMFDDLRSQKFPEKFQKDFPVEFLLIKSLLQEKPKDRPEAAELKSELEKLDKPVCEKHHSV